MPSSSNSDEAPGLGFAEEEKLDANGGFSSLGKGDTLVEAGGSGGLRGVVMEVWTGLEGGWADRVDEGVEVLARTARDEEAARTGITSSILRQPVGEREEAALGMEAVTG
jgi:hypothetical protein